MSPNVYLTRGLVGRDQDIDLFEQVFEESQVVTVETADPALDLISFAQTCSDFWVVNTGESVSQAVIVQGPPSFDQFNHVAPNNCLGLHPSPSSTPSHGLMRASHESISIDANSQEPLMECPDPQYEVVGTASSQPMDHNTEYSNLDVYRPSEDKNIAGFIYLLPSSSHPDPLHFEEYNVGITLRPDWRGKGVAEEAMHLALDVVFARRHVHRVQACLIDCYENDSAFTFFTRMGFSHEGTRRQAFFSPLTREWKDVTTLAILATDWLLYIRERRNDFRSAPKSLWESLFMRHQKEREELLRWEERHFYRNASLETIREGIVTPAPVPDTSDAETSSHGSGGNSERPKRKLFEIGYGDATDNDALTSEYGSEREGDYTSAVEGSPPKRFRSRRDETYDIPPHIGRASSNSDPEEEHRGEAEGSPGAVSPRDDADTTIQFDIDQLCETPNSSRSSSIRPDSRGSSVPSSPSELETESEDGYASLSAESESSTWELVDIRDNFGA